MHLVIFPFALVYFSVFPSEYSLSTSNVVSPVTLVLVPIQELIKPLSISKPTLKLPLIKLSLFEFISAKSLFLVFRKSACVDILIFVVVNSFPFFEVVCKFTNIFITVVVDHCSISMFLIISPLPLIIGSILIFIDPKPFFLSLLPLAMIRIPICVQHMSLPRSNIFLSLPIISSTVQII